MDNIWQLLPEVLNDVILERLVEGDVVDFCGVAILWFGFFDQFCDLFVFEGKTVANDDCLVLAEEFLVPVFGWAWNRTLRDHLQEFSASYQISHCIQTSQKLTIGKDHRVCRPFDVMSQPVPHSLIFNNVVIGILDFMFFHDLEHLAGEPTFRIGWCTLGKNYHRTAFHNILSLWMPYKHIFLKLLFVFFGGLAQQVKQTANVIFFIAI